MAVSATALLAMAGDDIAQGTPYFKGDGTAQAAAAGCGGFVVPVGHLGNIIDGCFHGVEKRAC